MTTSVPHRVGLYLALVQFFFTLTWTVYVIFLPRLAAEAGIPKQMVVFILMLDQLIFAVMDLSMGLLADRVSHVVGRLGTIVLSVTLLSCLAFLLLPLVAPHAAGWLLIALIVLWSASSSVLRAPPLMLLGKYAARPALPWLSALTLFGLGAASSISPYLTVVLRDTDPRLPFALSSAALALATLGIVWVERWLASHAEATGPDAAPAAPASAKPVRPLFWFMFSVALLGLGFQVHSAINSASLYLRFAKPAELERLMPVFWIGFNLLMLPATLATQRYGGLAVMGAGAVVGAMATWAATAAGSLDVLVAMQFIAGGAWGCVLMSAVAAALVIGHSGREGTVTGTLFCLLALATFARMAVVAAQLNQQPDFAPLLDWTPMAAWAFAGVLLLLLLPMQRRAATGT